MTWIGERNGSLSKTMGNDLYLQESERRLEIPKVQAFQS